MNKDWEKKFEKLWLVTEKKKWNAKTKYSVFQQFSELKAFIKQLFEKKDEKIRELKSTLSKEFDSCNSCGRNVYRCEDGLFPNYCVNCKS